MISVVPKMPIKEGKIEDAIQALKEPFMSPAILATYRVKSFFMLSGIGCRPVLTSSGQKNLLGLIPV